MSYKLNVIDREGNKSTINIDEGTTMRDAIEDHLSPDNYGICGGNCSCGTCHIYIKPSDMDKLSSIQNDEKELLNTSSNEINEFSRLACQIEFEDSYDDITVTIAPD